MAVLLASVLTGCSLPVYKSYTGSALPRNQVAILALGTVWQPQQVNVDLIAVDGRLINDAHVSCEGRLFKVELLPGQHTISLIPTHAYFHYTADASGHTSVKVSSVIDKTFDAEAGKTYVVVTTKIDPYLSDWTWNYEITEPK